jgi:hypothetical protein
LLVVGFGGVGCSARLVQSTLAVDLAGPPQMTKVGASMGRSAASARLGEVRTEDR